MQRLRVTVSKLGRMGNPIASVVLSADCHLIIELNKRDGAILVTGDISGNQEMVNCWARITTRADGNVCTPEGGNTDDGILMGCWAGAALSKSPAAPMVHQYTPSSKSFNLIAFVMS